MLVKERYSYNWYQKRIKQNAIIKEFLISIIFKHAEEDFPWTKKDLWHLTYADLLEIAVVAANKSIHIQLSKGFDFSNGGDSKFSIVRNHSNGTSYSSGVTGCKNKKFILACVYEGIQEKFYFFAFPQSLDEHSIPFDPVTGDPKRTTRNGKNKMWEKYECDTFEIMAAYALLNNIQGDKQAIE